ncbi:kinase-like domain-containing protein [Hypoxylon sp. FL1150]|nr:kinase-like domain-containing protein [Hypoxylon sp. FL1150]
MDSHVPEYQDIASQLASMSLEQGGYAISNGLIPDEELIEAVAKTGYLGLFSRTILLPDYRTVVKQGTADLLTEAQTMEYVRRYTSIPVPKVYEVRGSGNDAQILMEYVEGFSLFDAWHLFSDGQKDSVVAQLRGYFKELASITSPVASAIDGSPVKDEFFDFAPNKVCSDESEFNEELLKAWYQNSIDWSETEPQFPVLCNKLNETMRGNKFVLTHNNIHPRNILVRGSQVVAIVDWAQASFLPEYWEYCRPWTRCWDICSVGESVFTKDRILDQILTPRKEEFEVFRFKFSKTQTKMYHNPDKQWRRWDSMASEPCNDEDMQMLMD